MEEIKLKVFINGKEVGEIDMGEAKPHPTYKEDWFWSVFGSLKVGNYYPYHYSISLTRKGNVKPPC